MFFNEPRYARQALANSLVRIGTSPVWVGEVNDDYCAELYYPMNGKSSSANLTEVKGLNLEPVPLGYVNLRGTAKYVQRIPRRRWKQGFNKDSSRGNINERDIRTKQFGNCILGRYPSFDKALLAVKNKKVKSLAFDRHWAIQIGIVDPTLLYKERYVGIVVEGVCKLTDDFDYLTEALQEVLSENS